MSRHEVMQRVILKAPANLDIEVSIGGRELTTPPTTPLDASSFVVRRGGGHPLARTDVFSQTGSNEIDKVKKFLARNKGKVNPGSREALRDDYACRGDVTRYFSFHGDDLAGMELVRHGLNNDPFVDPNNEFGLFFTDEDQAKLKVLFDSIREQEVRTGDVLKWAITSGENSGKSVDDRGKLAVQGFARLASQMEFEVNQELEDFDKPFLVRTAEESELFLK